MNLLNLNFQADKSYEMRSEYIERKSQQIFGKIFEDTNRIYQGNGKYKINIICYSDDYVGDLHKWALNFIKSRVIELLRSNGWENIIFKYSLFYNRKITISFSAPEKPYLSQSSQPYR